MNDTTKAPFTPAFPFSHDGDTFTGMSLRDYLAGQALVGILAGAARSAFNDVGMSQWAYQIADAMIVQRAKGGAL